MTLVVPRAWTIVKTAEFPLIVKETLSDVISYELDRLTPLSPEKAFYDFRILAEDENRIRIMIAAMKAETLQPYLDALKEKGITIGGSDLSAAGATRPRSEGKWERRRRRSTFSTRAFTCDRKPPWP